MMKRAWTLMVPGIFAFLLAFSIDVHAQQPADLNGDYVGTLGPLSLKLHITAAPDGSLSGTLDSPNQGANGIPCSDFRIDGRRLSFKVPAVNGTWTGTIENGGATLSGTWSQGAPMPLVFSRDTFVSAAQPSATAFPVTYDPAIPPVRAADMESVLRRDLDKTLRSGVLSSNSQISVAIGVVRDGERRVFVIGTATPDAIFEIGSITKTFTGLMLAQSIEQGDVKPDTPVRELLPKDTIPKPAGDEITLLDLVTQRSGLPRMPGNFRPADPVNPYADYGDDDLYAFMREHGVGKPATPQFLYSNLGFALLGEALAKRANSDYAALLEHLVLQPMGLDETSIALDTERQHRFIQGHDADRQPASAWDLTSFAGAGAIRSTASDMLSYLEAQLQAAAFQPKGTTPSSRSLAAALARSQTPQADASGPLKIAYAWLYNTRTGTYWHNGGTGGFSSFAFFNPKGRYAAIVLVNMTLTPRGSFADSLGQHIDDRFAGRQALSLAAW